MIVERFTFKMKGGCEDEVVKLLKAAAEESGMTPRVCRFLFGPLGIVTTDLEFETEEDRQKFWAGYDWSQPAIAEWRKREDDLCESGGRHELLNVY